MNMNIRYEIFPTAHGFGYEVFENNIKTWRQENLPEVSGVHPMSHAEAIEHAEALVALLHAATAEEGETV